LDTQNKIATLFLTLCCLLVLASSASAQGANMLYNGSFEDTPHCCTAPKGWTNCGPPDETAPDIQPGLFEVELEPNDGNTYLGMVVRDNDTREAVGQKLRVPLIKDSYYLFSVTLAQSDKYISLSRATREVANYNIPVVLKVYGGSDQNEHCSTDELLLTIPYIDHTYWEEYEFFIQPKQTHQYIKLEVDWAPQFRDLDMDPYNGNLLLDNCSLTQVK
jgi:hypothetical protein